MSTGVTRAGRVAVVGAGFGGSLIALIAAKLGYEVLLTEQGRLPRFAIGESSTPMADLILSDLCERYDLAALKPLCSWGSWKRELAEVGCGLKRGFTYLAHRPGQPFSDTADHARSLLVAASPDDASGDTHWLRSDVDLHFLAAARAAGVTYRDGVAIQSPEELGDVDLIIDASGRNQALATALGAADVTGRLRTRTWATWAHFDDVPRWPDAPTAPYPAEAAAVHHLLDEAWIWALRFDHGVVSLGLVSPTAAAATPDAWDQQIAGHPALASWLAQAREITPRQSSAGRLQTLVTPAAGPGWAMLPSASGFVDPLHSAGIAHTLRGVERLAHLLEAGLPLPGAALAAYSDVVEREHLHLDRLVSGCYARLMAGDTAGFFAFTKLYFVAAIVSEHRRRGGSAGAQGAFLLADDSDFVGRLDRAEAADSEAIHALLRPIDPIGVCDPVVPNRIPFG